MQFELYQTIFMKGGSLGELLALLYPKYMPKILVTGANGFAGQHVVAELVNSGYEVVAIGGSQAADIKETSGISYMTLDLTDRAETEKINFNEVMGVVHLAGMTSVGASFDQPMQYMMINIGIVINLFESALKQGARPRFLIVSSGTLYDPKASQPLTETSPVLPNSPYAVSKIGKEQMAQYYATRGFETVIARPFNHIGPGQGPGFIVPDFAKQIVAIEKGTKDSMVVGNLDAKRDYTDVRDIARAYRLLLEKGKSGEAYNICSGNPISGHEILEGLSKAANINPKVEQDPDKVRPSDTPVLVGSHDKLTADTGWQPKISLEKTLSDVIEYWKDQSS
jgi:GDP-4-dehydro-6-deoxy-D-mannose reductase